MYKLLRTKILLWFVLVVVAVAIAGLSGFRRLKAYIRQEAEAQIGIKLEHVMDVLAATNNVYRNLVHSSMGVLKMQCTDFGPPRKVPLAEPGPGGITDTLYFGQKPIAGDNAVVDQVQKIMGGTATIFIRQGENFIRITTNVRKDDGSRAVGTMLDPHGPAIAALRQGKAYYGIVDILGKPYITGYEPIFDDQGEVVGAYYTGYMLEELKSIREAIEERGVLASGFFVLCDPKDEPIFLTKDVENSPEAIDIAKEAASDRPITHPKWFVRKVTFTPWDYDVVAALYKPDVSRKAAEIIWQVYGVGGIIIFGVLVVSFILASRLSSTIGEMESARQEAITARDAAESANRTKSTFLANMSHELRTPMNAIIGYSEMLIEEAEDIGVKELVPDLQKIRSAGKHLLALINDVLDLSKIEAGKMTLFLETFSVNEMVQEAASTIQPLLEKNSNKLEIVCPEDGGSMRADLTKVRQTLFNLFSNAAKFTEKGRITLTVARRHTESGERISFAVSDTGIGMTEEQLSKLFMAFTQADASTTRKYGGTGLGLVISRKFCQMMGGDISVSSVHGEGTTFTVDLPAEVAEAAAGAAAAPSTKPSPAKMKLVLVIDDDQDSAEILQRNLSKSGYEVVVAHSGPAGIEIARKMKPAAITLDVMMPGMDGWSVLTALKSDPETSGIPVILVTMLQDRQLGFTLGAAEFLTKPVNQDKLRQVLAKYCGQPSAYTLVVEDDPGNRQLICRMLEKQGLRYQEAENGSIALERIATEIPALILLDLMMPVMDGFEFLSLLRQHPGYERIPVVVITAKDLTAQDRERLLGSVNQVIQKGAVDREKLIQDIMTLLARAEKK